MLNNELLEEKNSALREVRKLNSVLERFGDILVPSLEGQKETTALQRLFYFLDILNKKFGLNTEEKLIEELKELEKTYPSK